ncbi:Hpt domain-containing protein [Xiashengella succiniciproducens]|jgi:chemotaxis protein histidine kinase CheA|uniref:Hpt domain-containing protein n=1 Tax=Xiashengella succiniciproducens TaxID=2949635 RepID=A0A9J6ZQN7_9BACT|nr:Hpt domain-containing protein [Alkaliflexus sp. Ai-910]MDI9539522.1 Hpt domain-containing protein [Bacteroidota bacterium]URW79846.1 Hpt domain-containing protein [Alkaliflexus sp. Ai-910]
MMLAEVKKQFYINTLKELDGINGKLSRDEIPSEEQSAIADKIFTISHQISGTGPMLGFNNASQLSKKLELTYNEIRNGKRELTPQILWQTRRTIDAMIKAFQEEYKEG